MKSFLAFVWKRRWCRLLGVGVILCAVPLLHPFIRQSAFGPKLDGVPWCVWEDEIREAADASPRTSWFYQVMARVGLFKRREEIVELDVVGLAPVYLSLADDDNVKVRRFALQRLRNWAMADQYIDGGAVVGRHVEDSDPECRRLALDGLFKMANVNDSLFEPVAKLAEDSDVHIRTRAILAMRHFGTRAVPVLRKALHDPEICCYSLVAASELGENAAALCPDLIRLEADPSPQYRALAAEALHAIDPKQFAKPVARRD